MKRPLISLLLAAVLAGCQVAPERPPIDRDTVAANRNLSQWQLRGKIGIRQPGSADSAYLNWLHCDDYNRIQLSGPLGQGAVRLTADPAGAELTLASGEQWQATSAEQLIREQLTWPVPVAALEHWILGLADPGQRRRTTDRGFVQGGWQLEVLKWQSVAAFTLPEKLRAENAELGLTVLINQWNLSPDCSHDQR